MIISNVKLQSGIFDIEIKNGKIVKVGKFSEYSDLDAKGNRLIPGFIDVHLHGFKGVDSSDCEFYKIGDALVKEGTTSWLPTLMTNSADNLERITHSDSPKGKANVLGFHLEGPYLSLEKSGAQNKEYIKAPNIEEYKRFSNVRMITVAPESEGSLEFIRSADTIVSIGHTNCDHKTAIDAIEAGANCLTHTFNAMPPMLHRAPGPIGAAVEKQIYAQIICDGLHVERSVLLAAYKMFGSDRLVLISDMIRPAGMPDGVYDSGGYDVYVKNSVARLKDGTLAGGGASLLYAVKKAVEFGIDFYEAVKMATETPAKLLNVNKGAVKEGYDADLVLIDDKINVLWTMVGGDIVYSLS